METKNPRRIARAIAQPFLPLKLDEIRKVNRKEKRKYYVVCVLWFVGVFICGPVSLWLMSHNPVQCFWLIVLWAVACIFITYITRHTTRLKKQGGAPKKEAMALKDMFTDYTQALKFNSFMKSRKRMSAPQVRSLLDYVCETHLDGKVSKNMFYSAAFAAYSENFTFKNEGNIRQAKPDDSIILEYKKYEKLA